MANSRFRCASCKLYFAAGVLFRTAGLSRFCSTECYSSWLDSQRKKGHAKVKKATSLQSREKRRSGPRTPVEVRLAVRERDGGLCRFCGHQGFHAHHVVYRSQGGADVAENLVLLCPNCHQLVHSSKAAFQPVLLADLEQAARGPQRAFIPELARRLELDGKLTQLQRERFGLVPRRAAS